LPLRLTSALFDSCPNETTIWATVGEEITRENQKGNLNFWIANHPHKAAAHAIPPSRRSDADLNFRLSRWTDALRLFVVVYCVSHFVSIILRNEAALFVTTP
jgi:hypothetical protein